MTRNFVLNINDARLGVAGEGRVLHVEPGFAVVDGSEILTGHAAYGRSRLMPRHTSHTHWVKLSTEPGSAGIDGVSTAAELAHAQLDRLWQPFREAAGAAYLAVPSDYSNQDLGVLLGLAQECKIPVAGMVNAAVAASVRPFPGCQMLYVDAGLHGVTVTPIEQGEEATSLPGETIDTGLAALMDAFARRIAEVFVLETRFDPLHEATAEQALFDGLSTWIPRLMDADSTTVEISFRGEVFSIELSRSVLLGAGQGFLRALQQLVAQMRHADKPLVVQVSDKLAEIPGVVETLNTLDDSIIVCQPPGHVAVALLESAHLIGGGGDQVRLYRHLPWRAQADDAPVVSKAPRPQIQSASAPTHIVYKGVAYPVNGEGLVIGRDVADGNRSIVVEGESQGISRSHCRLVSADGELRLQDTSRYGTFVNERRIEAETVLQPADVIRIGSPGAELIVIRLDAAEEVSGHAP